MDPIIPIHRERLLRTEEARILTVARQPGFKATPAVAAQLAAYTYAEDLYDIHDVTAGKYAEHPTQAHRADMHRNYAAQAHQLKLLALDTLSTLTSPLP
jgi:uridylate kinase